MPMLISQINVAPDAASFRDDVTKLQIVRQKMPKGNVVPFLKMFKEDGPHSRYLVELVAVQRSSDVILKGGAQFVIAAERIAGLMISGEFKNVIAKRSIKLNQDAGQMACFSINCDELGLVAVPTNRRDKATAIHFGSEIQDKEGFAFALRISMAVGFLNSDGASGRATIEQIVSRLAATELVISRGTSLY
jgi:hypothetical protein